MSMKLGYIVRYDLERNPYRTERFVFKEASFIRSISGKGDRVRCSINPSTERRY